MHFFCNTAHIYSIDSKTSASHFLGLVRTPNVFFYTPKRPMLCNPLRWSSSILPFSSFHLSLILSLLLCFEFFSSPFNVPFVSAAKSVWQIEHMFVDDPALDAAQDDEVTPMLFKCVGGCDRGEGSVSTGSRIVIEGSKWTSINGRTFVLEATSGWFFVLEEDAAAHPHQSSVKVCGMPSDLRYKSVRPTQAEYDTIFSNNEKGYLTKGNAGQFRIIR